MEGFRVRLSLSTTVVFQAQRIKSPRKVVVEVDCFEDPGAILVLQWNACAVMMSAARAPREACQLTDVQPPVECPRTLLNPFPFPLGMVSLVHGRSCGNGRAPGVEIGGQKCGTVQMWNTQEGMRGREGCCPATLSTGRQSLRVTHKEVTL
ncbi:hypothetical protein COCON_G00154100 [Conger conger]|uniref:Uncharacterized protein n=1 Tax=Conger conger TaxID=82655 RepID=A0A9Q1D8V0_CONCO|nr:hypothetical protein COCON_G00154100 [Conger conger]